MKVDIEYSPAYAIANIGLDAGEGLRAEAGAMVAMSSSVGMETKAEGGLMGGLKRMALGGESFFINTYTAQGGPGEVTVGPSLPGDVIHLPLAGHTVFVQSGSYLACGTGIEVDTKWGGAKTFFSGEGLFLLKIGRLHHLPGLLVHYRLRGKPKRPICSVERKGMRKVSDAAWKQNRHARPAHA